MRDTPTIDLPQRRGRGRRKQIQYQHAGGIDAHHSDRQSIGTGRRGRKENGLEKLTKTFISLLREAPNQTLDLNKAVKQLEV